MTNAPPLAENEFRLIQAISRRPTHTQRSLSRNIGLSLGTTNLLIRRLARKGLIKIHQLDWKRTQYLLTLKGAVEKTRKSYAYAHYTLRIFGQIQENIASVLHLEHGKGRRTFHVVAQDELSELISRAISGMNLDGASFVFHRAFTDVPASADLILTATLEAPPPGSPASRFMSLVDFDNINFRL